jgi:hypothetical protein
MRPIHLYFLLALDWNRWHGPAKTSIFLISIHIPWVWILGYHMGTRVPQANKHVAMLFLLSELFYNVYMELWCRQKIIHMEKKSLSHPDEIQEMEQRDKDNVCIWLLCHYLVLIKTVHKLMSDSGTTSKIAYCSSHGRE